MTVVESRQRFDEELRSLLARAEHVRTGTRREGDLDRPLGPKAARTRAAIVDAGIDVFCERGYQSSTVAHVHERAGVSLGTYYQYFRDKTDLVSTIVAETVIVTADRVFHRFDPGAGREGARQVVHGFVHHYATTAAFQRVWEEVTHLEPDVADFRHRISRLLETSLAASIDAGQSRGRIVSGVDAALTARALSAMVDRTCYLTFVVDGAGREAIDPVSDTLSSLWANALAPGRPPTVPVTGAAGDQASAWATVEAQQPGGG